MISNKNLDKNYIKNVKHLKIYPIFIIGLPRSGTSILYKILAETKKFNYITTYNIICYNQLIHNFENNLESEAKEEINRHLDKMGINDRGTDKIKICPDVPEEYGYILNKKTYETYITKKNFNFFLEICKKIQYISNNDKPILLKNTSEFKNLSFIKANMPNAKFIFISREPEKIVNSAMNSVNALMEQKNPYYSIIQPNYRKLFGNPLSHFVGKIVFSKIPIFGLNYVLNTFSNDTRNFIQEHSNLSNYNVIIVKYEDLCNNTKEEVIKIMNFLNIEFKDEASIEGLINKREINTNTIVLKMKKLIHKKLKQYYDFFDYNKD